MKTSKNVGLGGLSMLGQDLPPFFSANFVEHFLVGIFRGVFQPTRFLGDFAMHSTFELSWEPKEPPPPMVKGKPMGFHSPEK